LLENFDLKIISAGKDERRNRFRESIAYWKAKPLQEIWASLKLKWTSLGVEILLKV
jgi:hypothetical protein